MFTSELLKVRSRRLVLTVVALLILGLFAAAAVDFKQPLSGLSTQREQGIAGALASQTQAPTSSESILSKTVEHEPLFWGEPVASLQEARALVPFAVLVPQSLPEGFSLVWIGAQRYSLPSGQATNLNLGYSVGEHKFIVEQRQDGSIMPPVTDNLLAQLNRHQKATIKGCLGIGHERETVTVRGQGQQTPTSVMWWCDGVIRTVLSYDLSLAEVQAIAESMQ